MEVKFLQISKETDPEVMQVINDLANLEGRKPHDTAKRLILQAGKARIEQIRQVARDKTLN